MTRLRESAPCSTCGFKIDLRRDGTVGKHHRWRGSDYKGICPGTGQPPRAAVSHALPSEPAE